jgi:hypothetical protein
MPFDCHPLLVGMWNNSLAFTVPCVTLPAGTRTVPEFYDLDAERRLFKACALERLLRAKGQNSFAIQSKEWQTSTVRTPLTRHVDGQVLGSRSQNWLFDAFDWLDPTSYVRRRNRMSSRQRKMTYLAVVGVAAIPSNTSLAHSQTTATQSDQPNRISIAYGQPNNSAFSKLYDILRERRALERIQEILSPLRMPEQLTIKTTECGAVNSYYKRENFKPTVTICYELLKNILDSLPNETTPAGVAPADAAVEVASTCPEV